MATDYKRELSPKEKANRFNIMTYYPPGAFENFLREKANKWCYIHHNLDTGVTPHYHVMAIFQNPTTLERIHDSVDSLYQKYCDENAIEYRKQRMTATLQNPDDVFGSVGYYLHDNDDCKSKGKHLYDKAEIVCNSESYFLPHQRERPNPGEANEEFLNDLLNFERKEQEQMRFMAKKYGRDYIKNYNSYTAFAYRLRELEYVEKSKCPAESVYAKYYEEYRRELLDRIDRCLELLGKASALDDLTEIKSQLDNCKSNYQAFIDAPIEYPDFIFYCNQQERINIYR